MKITLLVENEIWVVVPAQLVQTFFYSHLEVDLSVLGNAECQRQFHCLDLWDHASSQISQQYAGVEQMGI